MKLIKNNRINLLTIISILIFLLIGCSSGANNGLQLNIRVEDNKNGSAIVKAQVIVELGDGSNYRNTQTDSNGYAFLYFDETFLNKPIKIIVRKEGYSDFVKNNVLAKDFPTVIPLTPKENVISGKTTTPQSGSEIKPITRTPTPLPEETPEKNPDTVTSPESKQLRMGSSDEFFISKGSEENFKFNGNTNNPVAFIISRAGKSSAFFDIKVYDAAGQPMSKYTNKSTSDNGGYVIFTPPKESEYVIKITGSLYAAKFKISMVKPEEVIK
jgi:hypothetical protein